MNPNDLSRVHDLAGRIELALLRPDATAGNIVTLCAEARARGLYGVCINGAWVELARHELEESNVKVVSVVGFPLGACDTESKRFETEAAVDNGAHEIDMVLNVGWLKDKNDRFVLRELRDVVEAADERPVKVILEVGLLTQDEIIRACHLTLDSGAQFVKSCTGFGPRGVTVEDVNLMRQAVGAEFGIKASGGIRDTATALALVGAGATRLGVSNAAAILEPAS
jgi:deoxyribose-phosphate aldolase